MKTGNRTVDKMMQVHLTGNVTPMNWYQTITRENGKPHLTAIAILSDIVYWYRPREVRDEQSGELLGFEKRFRGDLLQRGYGQLAEQFGLSKRQVMAAVTVLEELGVIKKVLRNTVIGGVMAGNVMFLDLNVERLIELTYPVKKKEPPDGSGKKPEQGDENYDDESEAEVPSDSEMSERLAGVESEDTPPYTKKCNTLIQKSVGGHTEKSSTLIQKNVIGHTKKCRTNTKDYTETTTENPSSSPPYREAEKVRAYITDRFDAEFLCQFAEREMVEDTLSILLDVLTSPAKTIRVNREDRPAGVVKAAFYKLDQMMVAGVLHELSEYDGQAHHIRNLLITMLYNASMSRGLKRQNNISLMERERRLE